MPWGRNRRMDAPIVKRNATAPGMKPWMFGLVLVGLLLLAFPKVLLGLHSFFFRDYGVLGYPFVHFHRESFWNGELPVWNPYSNCGTPFLAQWGTMTLYPGSLIYLLLPLPWSLTVFCFAHLVLGGVGMFALTRRWVGDGFAASVAGTAFVFSGTMFSCLLWPNYTVALGWMPWIVLLVERSWREGGRWLVAAALAGTMQMLVGVPELVVLTWLLLGVLWVTEVAHERGSRWTLARRFAVVVGLVAALAAAQLLPFLELLGQSQRDHSFTSSKWPMPIWGLANLLVPLFHTYPSLQGPHMQAEQQFLSSYYPGAAVLVLAVCALAFARNRRVWALACLIVFALLMAWGENGFLFPLVKQFVPVLGIARYPIKFLLLAAFALPLLAAWTIQALTIEDEALPKRRRTLAIVGGAALAMIGFLAWSAWANPLQSPQWSAEDNATLAATEWRFVGANALGRAAFIIALLGLLYWLPRIHRVRVRWAARGAIVACLFLDVLTHAPQQNPSVPASAFAEALWETETGRPPPRLGESRVLISPSAEQRLLYSTATNAMHDFLGKRLGLWSNLNLLDRAPKVNGSSTLQLREQAQVQALIYSATNQFGNGLIQMLGVSLVSLPENPTRWLPVTNYCPLVSGGQAPIFAAADETLRALPGKEFDPRRQVFLRREDQARIQVTNSTEVRIVSSHFAATRVEARIEASEPSLIVISQSFCAGWRARVNGREVPILRANHAFQAVEVPAGQHELVLTYRDAQLLLGGAISLTALFGCGFYCWMTRRRERRQLMAPVVSDPEALRPAA